MYKPSFKCPHCEQVIEAKMSSGIAAGGLAHGYVSACPCPESQRAWELDHRMRVEARKRAKGKR